ncbi:MAG: type IV toxin-antitoxin system AbiEi family antitoxin [Bacteroidota bacterium]
MQVSRYIAQLEAQGILYFTIHEAVKSLKISKEKLYQRLYHFKKKRIIVSPVQGLYVIVPIQHRAIGCMPPEELIVIVMKYLKVPFYAGLLTAAAYHGATHQRLRVFQVVSSKRFFRDIIIGDVWIEFIYKKDITSVAVAKKEMHAGYLPISTPEETAKDVMRFYKKCGGLNHQATVLAELTKAINPQKLIFLARKSDSIVWVQRMGYMLEVIETFYEKERDSLVAALAKFLAHQQPKYAPLAREIATKGKPRNRKWKIIENATIESDI